MIRLEARKQSIEAVLDAAAHSAELQFAASWTDIPMQSGQMQPPFSATGLTTGVTAATIVPYLTIGAIREIAALSVYNADTINATVTIRLNDNGSYRTLVKQTLEPGFTLHYTSERGFFASDDRGGILASNALANATLIAILGLASSVVQLQEVSEEQLKAQWETNALLEALIDD